MTSLQSISAPSQLPEFVRSYYPVFIEFVKAYYKWMGEQNAAFGDVVNIDTAPEEFVQFFKSQLDVYQHLSSSPYFDIRYLKNIKQIYASKGSEKLLVRILELVYNSNATVDYPGKYILRASDGKWERDYFIILSPEYGTIPAIFDYFYIKSDNKERVRVTRHNILSNGKLKIFFSSSERVTILADNLVEIQDESGEIMYVGRVQRTTVGLNVIDGSINWQLGQVFKIPGTVTNSYGKVTKVNLDGTVLQTAIYDFGYDHTEGQIVTAYPSPIEVVGEEASFETVYGVVGKMTGYWRDDSGKISHQTIRLPDNFYYQIFSYVVTSDVPTNSYIEFANKINPAGNKLFTTYNRDYRISLPVDGRTIVPNRYLYFGPEFINVQDDAPTLIFDKVPSIDNVTAASLAPVLAFTKVLEHPFTADDSIRALNFTKDPGIDPVTATDSAPVFNFTQVLAHSVTMTDLIGFGQTGPLDEPINISEELSISPDKILAHSVACSDGTPVKTIGPKYNDTGTYFSEVYNITNVIITI